MRFNDFQKNARLYCGIKSIAHLTEMEGVHAAQLKVDAANEDTVISIAANGKSSKVSHTFAAVTFKGNDYTASQTASICVALGRYKKMSKKSEFEKIATLEANFPKWEA